MLHDFLSGTCHCSFSAVRGTIKHCSFCLHSVLEPHIASKYPAWLACARWVSWWSQLLTDVIADPLSKNRVMIDLMNEPDVLGLRCAPDQPEPCMQPWNSLPWTAGAGEGLGAGVCHVAGHDCKRACSGNDAKCPVHVHADLILSPMGM